MKKKKTLTNNKMKTFKDIPDDVLRYEILSYFNLFKITDYIENHYNQIKYLYDYHNNLAVNTDYFCNSIEKQKYIQDDIDYHIQKINSCTRFSRTNFHKFTDIYKNIEKKAFEKIQEIGKRRLTKVVTDKTFILYSKMKTLYIMV